MKQVYFMKFIFLFLGADFANNLAFVSTLKP
jgi:hypothetical protein